MTRLISTNTIYHQTEGQQPTAVESRFARQVGDEQPYLRTLRVTGDWRPLDRGWIEQAAMLVVTNDEGRAPQVQPTDAERKATAARIIELGLIPTTQVAPPGPPEQLPGYQAVASFEVGTAPPIPFALVRPGESLRLEPADIGLLAIRCQSETAKCLIALFPN